jgi:hypothetical protein
VIEGTLCRLTYRAVETKSVCREDGLSTISKENAYIFRITHIENVPWILRNGIHCRNSATRDPNFREIGNLDLIAKRKHRIVPVGPGGTLGDYVPFYFTPHSPMLLNIKTGHNGMRQTPMPDIVIFVSSLHRVVEQGLPFVFTDRHAYPVAAQYFTDLGRLDAIDWKILQTRDFKRDPNDLGKMERYMAEALVLRHVPLSALLGVACHGPQAETRLLGMQQAAGVSLKTVVKQDWYF